MLALSSATSMVTGTGAPPRHPATERTVSRIGTSCGAKGSRSGRNLWHAPTPVSEPDPHRYRALAPRPPEGPIDLGAVLPGSGPIELEIGYGRGTFLIERATTAPRSRLIGIEIKTKWSTLVAERAARLGLGNVRAWCGDAREILARSGPDGSVARVFVHFPDPWWKKRHARRRVVGDVLLAEVARLLAPGGELFVQTDVEDRAEDYRTSLSAHDEFVLAGEDGRVAENPYGARSNREKRAIADGLPIYRILAHRRKDATASAISAPSTSSPPTGTSKMP